MVTDFEPRLHHHTHMFAPERGTVCRLRGGSWIARSRSPRRAAGHIRELNARHFNLCIGLLLTFGLALPHRDMLELSQVTGGWSFEWSRAHFGAWCIISSPLILGLDLLSSVQMEQMWPIISNRCDEAFSHLPLPLPLPLPLTPNQVRRGLQPALVLPLTYP